MPEPFSDYAKPDRHEHEAMHDGEPCLFCGRKVRVGQGTVMAHLIDGGANLASIEDDAEPNSDLGFFPVGSDCAKRLPPSYRFYVDGVGNFLPARGAPSPS